MNALADEKVGDYLNRHFAAAAQKVGTFRIVGDQKLGGNVASYFCRVVGDDLHVVHCVPGPVDAQTFLAEARFAVELHNQAMLDGAKNWQKYGTAVQNGFRDRAGTGAAFAPAKPVARPNPKLPRVARGNDGTTQGQVNESLAKTTLPKLVTFYPYVWEKVLFEKLSAAPVVVK